jgi:hypothetical protein
VDHGSSPQQRSRLDLDATLRSARRKSVIQSGVSKGPSASRRSTLGGVIGNTVIIDGTPRTSLAELLKEAEATVILEEGLHGLLSPKVPSKLPRLPQTLDMLITPARHGSNSSHFEAARSVFTSATGSREWSKADWKVLDICYTDERLDLGLKSGLGSGGLASAEDVDMEKVVDRFFERMGGTSVVGSLGPSWSR